MNTTRRYSGTSLAGSLIGGITAKKVIESRTSTGGTIDESLREVDGEDFERNNSIPGPPEEIDAVFVITSDTVLGNPSTASAREAIPPEKNVTKAYRFGDITCNVVARGKRPAAEIKQHHSRWETLHVDFLLSPHFVNFFCRSTRMYDMLRVLKNSILL